MANGEYTDLYFAAACDAPGNAPIVAFTLPEIPDISTTYFLRLTLASSSGKILRVNSYWLSTKPDVLKANEGEDSWNIRHLAAFADFTQLETLPGQRL